MTLFTQLLATMMGGANQYQVNTPDNWAQGRTLYGGISAALCLEAVLRDFPDLPELRSAQIAFAGPAGGTVDIATALLRRGKSAAFISSDLTAENKFGTRALFCFGQSRESHFSQHADGMPAVPPPESCHPYFPSSHRPNFVVNFDMLLARGAPPISGAAKGDNYLWIRHLDEKAPSNMVSLLALADAAPPAALSMFTAPAMISTMTWSLDVLQPNFTSKGGWWLCRSQTETISSGYSAQSMTVWNRDGVAILAGRQTIAAFA
jgi:acyl-CoA thioesterase